MRISIFTATHDPRYLREAYDSIKAQVFDEWVVLYNGKATPIGFEDARVKEIVDKGGPLWVGRLKGVACAHCTGDILLELDHDDLLTPDAVSEVRKSFEDNNIGFAYSNTIHCTMDGQPNQHFNECFGWRYRPYNHNGIEIEEHISFDPTPDSISRIWYAPNHLRAFRKSVYDAIGGYNKDMRILDDLDLMCRLYQVTTFKHIDRGLYIYRVHGENTWLKFNKEIQQNVYRIYDKYIEQLVTRWADLNGLAKIELGGRFGCMKGYTSVDLKSADVVCNLDNDWPFKDSSVGVIRSFDTFEHLKSNIHTMKECHRVLAPGGWVICQVPSTDGRGAFQDPTHISFWNENSFLYYTNKRLGQYIDSPVRFQAPRIYTTPKNKEEICWTVAHLINLKDGFRPAGLIEI